MLLGEFMSKWMKLSDYKISESVMTKNSSYTMNWDDIDDMSSSDDHMPMGMSRKHGIDRSPYDELEDGHPVKFDKAYSELLEKRKRLQQELRNVERSLIRITQMRGF